MNHQRSHSLGAQLARRVTILGAIAASAVVVGILVSVLVTLAVAHNELNLAGMESARTFDLFLASVESDLLAVGDNLSYAGNRTGLFRDALARNASVFELTLINPDGVVIEHRQRVGRSESGTVDEQPWLETVQNGQIYIGSVDSSEFGVPFTSLAVPYHDSEGNFAGSLVARLDLTALWSQVIAIQVGETGYAYVTDETGKLLAYRDLNLVREGNLLHDLVGLTPQEISQSRNQLAANIYTGVQGEPVIGTSIPLSIVSWYALVEQPIVEPLGRFAPVFIFSILISVLLFGGIYSTIRFTQRSIVKPLLDVREGIDILRGGNLEYRLNIPGHEGDEIGVLAETLNQMTGQLTRTIGELDNKVEELNTTNDELRVTTAKAREASRVKGEFLANISHELRTPLNAIIGFSDMLLMGMSGELNPKQTHKLERLRENGTRLLNLINDILDITRIEARRIEIVHKAFSPQAVIERLSAQTAVLAEQNKLRLDVAVDPALPEMIIGDEKRIEQIVVNMLSNAFKFTEKGTVTLDVRANEIDQTWTIAVSDTGIGIPPHAVNLIFEEFRQVDAGGTRAYKGSGLGLAITRNLVRMMDGQITVQSELGKGSTFTVILPLLTPETAKMNLLEKVEV